MNTRAISVFLSLWVAACSSIGPGTVSRDRVDYVNAIGNSWERETLLNIVKLRYGHAPTFLSITQVVTGYQLQSTLSAGFVASNFTPNSNVLGLEGTLGAQGQYTDRPTIIYTPLTGVDFLQKLLKPIPPSAVLFVLQAGYDATVLMPLTLDSINGINNKSGPDLRSSADPRFDQVVQLVRTLQLADALQVRIVRPKEGDETSLITFPTNKDPQTQAARQNLRTLLGVKPGLNNFNVYYGGYSGRDDEISMTTRSMLQIMSEIAAGVQVPRSDVVGGRAAPGVVEDQPDSNPLLPGVSIHSGSKVPPGVTISVQYDGRWFWIADTDFQSKRVFATLMLLFSISDIGAKATGPVVTVPANG